MSGRDFHHVDVRRNVRQHALHMCQSPRKHCETMGHLDLVILHDVQQIRHDRRHIDLPHLRIPVFHEKTLNILVEFSLIRTFFKLSDGKHCLLDQSDIAQSHTLYCFSDHLTVMLCQTTHHPHVDPDDLAFPDLYSAALGVRIKELVIHDLLDIVIDQFASDLFQVVSVLYQCIFVIDPESVDVLHDKHIDRCILLVEN